MNRTTAITATVITVFLCVLAGVLVTQFAPRRSDRTSPPITGTQADREKADEIARALASAQTPRTGIFNIKAITTAESLVRAMREDTPQVHDANHEPIAYLKLDIASRLKFEAEVRGLARDLLPDDRLPTRSEIVTAASQATTRDKFDYDFDATSGQTRVRVSYRHGVGSVVFNAYQLGASAAVGAGYLSLDVPPLPLTEP